MSYLEIKEPRREVITLQGLPAVELMLFTRKWKSKGNRITHQWERINTQTNFSHCFSSGFFEIKRAGQKKRSCTIAVTSKTEISKVPAYFNNLPIFRQVVQAPAWTFTLYEKQFLSESHRRLSLFSNHTFQMDNLVHSHSPPHVGGHKHAVQPINSAFLLSSYPFYRAAPCLRDADSTVFPKQNHPVLPKPGSPHY